MKAKLLDPKTELELAFAWRDRRCKQSLDRLTVSYLKMVLGVVRQYGHYGVSRDDLIGAGCIGLVKAAEKFDPERGLRFFTYAIWWIKFSIQDAVMREYSLVRVGSTSDQKILFFNFRRVRNEVEREAEQIGEVLNQTNLHEIIAQKLNVSVDSVEFMSSRLTGSDLSLDAPQGDNERDREWIETVEDTGPRPEEFVQKHHDHTVLKNRLDEVLSLLPERERYIVEERFLRPNEKTLGALGKEFGLSKERIRQLQAKGLRKMHKHLSDYPEVLLMLQG